MRTGRSNIIMAVLFFLLCTVYVDGPRGVESYLVSPKERKHCATGYKWGRCKSGETKKKVYYVTLFGEHTNGHLDTLYGVRFPNGKPGETMTILTQEGYRVWWQGNCTRQIDLMR